MPDPQKLSGSQNLRWPKLPLILRSKKFWVSLAGLIFAILAAKGVGVSPDMKAKIIELITVIVGSYNAGQGIADGVSGGRTSNVAIRAGTAKP